MPYNLSFQYNGSHAFASLYPAALIFRNTIVSGNMTIKKKDDKESPWQIPHLMLSRPNCLPVHHAVANIGGIYLTASQPRYKHWHLLDFVMVRQVDQNDIFN